MGRRNYTGLFSGEPSFWEGFARVLDVGGTFDSFDEHVSTPEDAYLALAADWYAVWADLHHAIKGEAMSMTGDLDDVLGTRRTTRAAGVTSDADDELAALAWI